MKLCTNCGAENHTTATYCITCGLPLTDTYTPLQQITRGGKPRVVILMAVVIAIAGFAATLFMVTGSNNNKTPGNNEVSNNENKMHSAEPEDEMEPDIPLQKLKNVSSPGKYVVDDKTLISISNKVSNFIKKNNKEDVEAILGYFEYPVSRYYDDYSVTREKLNTILQNTLVDKLEFHKLKPDVANGTVKYNGRNYEIVLNATYRWSALEKPDEIKSKKVRLKYVMNKNLKLTSAYEQ